MSIAVGIDIGSSAVKVAVLRVAYRKTTLEALASADVAESGGVVEAIRTAYARALLGKPADGIAVCIEGTRAVLHTISLPASAQKQLAEVLPFELEAALPIDMAESVFDYRVRKSATAGGPDEGGGVAQIPVQALVARTEDVKARIELVKEALKQEPERVDAGGLPLANLIPHIPALSEATVALVDLGAKTSEVVIIHHGEPVFARTATWGTQGLPGTAPRLARELRLTIGAHRAAGGVAPTRVYLCGGGGVFASGAEVFLASELDLPVEKLPGVTLEIGAVAPEPLQELPRFAKALGLALSLAGRSLGFDLRRGTLSYERGFAWIRAEIPVLAGLGAVLAVSFLFSAWAQLYAANKDVTTLEAALGSVTKEVLGEEITSASSAQDLLTQQSGGADDDPMPHVDAFDVMVKLSEDIPSSIVHDVEELDVQKQHAVVHGIVGSIPEAESIKTSLESERCFQDLKLSRFTQLIGTDRQKYVLDADLRCAEDGGGKKKKAASSGGGE